MYTYLLEECHTLTQYCEYGSMINEIVLWIPLMEHSWIVKPDKNWEFLSFRHGFSILTREEIPLEDKFQARWHLIWTMDDFSLMLQFHVAWAMANK